MMSIAFTQLVIEKVDKGLNRWPSVLLLRMLHKIGSVEPDGKLWTPNTKTTSPSDLGPNSVTLNL